MPEGLQQKIEDVRNDGPRVPTTTLFPTWTISPGSIISGGDVAYNPVAISYALISEEKAWLFINEDKVSVPVREHLSDNGVG